MVSLWKPLAHLKRLCHRNLNKNLTLEHQEAFSVLITSVLMGTSVTATKCSYLVILNLSHPVRTRKSHLQTAG